MIVVDTSALVAVLLDEPESEAFEAILLNEACVMSAVNLHEAACVMRARHGREGVSKLLELIAVCEITIEAFDEAQVRIAMQAFDRFGKGIDPRARLNLADCASYALATFMGLPLLCKGDDFAATDIRLRLKGV